MAWVAAMTPRPMLALLVALAVPAVAAAGSISITTTQSAKLDGKNLVVQVQVGNTGDEAAMAVTPILRFAGKEARGKRQESLPPNGKIDDTVTLEVGELGTGTWPYLVAVDYTDTNQYPFQAVQAGRLPVGNPPPAKVAIASFEADRLADEVDAVIEVKNLEGVPRTAALRVLPPDGIEAVPATAEVALDAWQSKPVTVSLKNRTALAGSSYPVFATVEYDADGAHFAVLGQRVVEIIPNETVVDRLAPYLWIGAVALGAAFVLLVGVRAVRR
jgi:hypothetical protein